MSKSGEALGADLYDLWNAGTHLLPKAAGAVELAYAETPVTSAYACARGGALGMGANGPAGALDRVLDLLNKALSDTGRNLREVGEALVVVADDFARTDRAAAAELHRKQRELGGVR